ncbi:MAG: gamma-glutamylcyclotransferase family protein [Vicinamibacterales bacterium]
MPRLFAYGTLLDPAVQQRVFGRQLDGTADALAGVVRATLAAGDGSGDAWPDLAVTGRPDDVVAGRLFKLSDAELAAADAYETAAYARTAVTLASGTRAWVYRGVRQAFPG